MKVPCEDVIYPPGLYRGSTLKPLKLAQRSNGSDSLSDIPDEPEDKSEAFSNIAIMSLSPKFMESLGKVSSNLKNISIPCRESIDTLPRKLAGKILNIEGSQPQISISGSTGAVLPASAKIIDKIDVCSIISNQGSTRAIKPRGSQHELRLKIFACNDRDSIYHNTDLIEQDDDDSIEANLEYNQNNRLAQFSLTDNFALENHVPVSDILPRAIPILRKQPTSNIDQRKSILKNITDCKHLTGDIFTSMSHVKRGSESARKVVFSKQKKVYLFPKEESDV